MEILNVISDLTVEPLNLRPGETLVGSIHVRQELEIGRMPRGTKQGRSTVMLKGRGPKGELVIFETTLRALATAVKTLEVIDGLREDARRN